MAADPKLVPFERAITATSINDVQVSPDGAQVAYVTGPLSKEEGPPASTIWLVAASGGAPRRLTGGDAGDGAPRWSPDGKRLAFISDRKERGKPQLYLLDLAGGEAVRLTDSEGGVGPAQWSPDGKLLAYTAMPGQSDEEKEYRKDHDEQVLDEWTKRAGLFVLDVPDAPASMSALPEARRLTPEDRHVGGFGSGGFNWAPDSQGLVTILGKSPRAEDLTAPEMALVDLNGNVTVLGSYEMASTPKFSPDGSTLAFVGTEDVIPAGGVLQTMPAHGGERKLLLEGYENSFQDFDWLPDGDRLLALSEEGQQYRMVIVDPESQELHAADAFKGFDRPVTLGSWFGPAYSLAKDGKTIAMVVSDDTSQGDLWITTVGSQEPPRRLTDLNPWTRDYQWGETRELRWNSFDGLEIQGLLILPVGYQEGQRYPLVTQIHGGPAGAWTHHLYANWHDWGQFLAQRGYAVFMANPRGSTGRGTKFLKGIVKCYGEPDWQDIITGVDSLIAQGIADPEQLVVGGWSGGGFLTNWTITHTDRFKAAVSGAGISNWVSFQGTADIRLVFNRYLGPVDTEPEGHWRLSPIRYVANAKTPTLILYGAADDRVPVTQGYELYYALKDLGVETKLVAYPREPHIIMERKHQLDLLTRVIDWFDGHLGRPRSTEQPKEQADA